MKEENNHETVSARRTMKVAQSWRRLRLAFAAVSFLSLLAPTAGQDPQCVNPLHGNASSSQQVYRVGVLAIRGFDAAYDEFNKTFSDYLTVTAGTRFDPPIRFEMTPLDFQLTNISSQVDFVYVNPFAFSCLESETGAQSLVSQVSRHVVEDTEYRLTQFGGVIFTREDSNITTIKDIKGKRVACASLWGLGSGQMQFRVLQEAGLSYINDPSQLVFTFNQEEVVQGVLRGDFDVGFVRTGQLELSLGMKPEGIRCLAPRNDLFLEDGVPFPFQSSTQLYPEWNVASLPHVPSDVALEVQHSMLALADHASVGRYISNCYNTCEQEAIEDEECKEACEAAASTSSRCDTTVPIALTAHEAMTRGRYAGFRTTLSYMELRNLQEETQFIQRDQETSARLCVRSTNLYDAITCPSGHYKKSKEEVARGCAEAGLECDKSFQCVCSPCKKAFEVRVFPLDQLSEVGCAKLDVCGTTEQTKELDFIAVDNKNRTGLHLVVRILEGKMTREIRARPMFERRALSDLTRPSSTNVYKFTVQSNNVGLILLEILADGEPIPESPIRVEIEERDCAAEFDDENMVADAEGNCACSIHSVSLGGKCVSYGILLPAIILPVLALFAFIIIYLYEVRKRKHSDYLWSVKKSELLFGDPPEIIGRGTFGCVLLAEYRGTQVAVKRVIPPRARKDPHTKRQAKSVDEDGYSSAVLSFLDEQETVDMNRLENGGLGDSNSTVSHHSSAKDDGEAAFDSTDKNYSGNLDLSVRSHDDLMVSRTPRRMARSQSMGHSSALGTIAAGSCAMESIRAPRRHSFNFAKGGSRSSPGTGLSSANISGASSPVFGGSGKVIRRKSIDAAVTAAFDIEAGGARESNARPNIVAPATLLERSECSSGEFSGSIGTYSFDSNSVTSKHWRWPWRRRDEYSRLKAEFLAEMRHISKLRHPCVTTVMGAVVSRKHEPMLVMEYMDHGSLYDILHNETMVLEGEVVLPILRDITCGVRFLHAASPQVIHGDLKAQNVLVDSKFRAKVSDFGLTMKRNVGATGTPLWMAPELLRGESDNTASSDVYSFGMILYEVYSRKDPYEGEDMTEVLLQVADPTSNKRPSVPASCPPMMASLMTECLVAEPLERPTFEELDLRLKSLDVSNVEPGKMRLSHQRQRPYSDLLNEVFPRHIADALRDGRKIEPESRDCVTIFFSDIVGFTTIASILPPIKVADMLDRLYLRFDMLSHKHDVFKVETIGDAYMAVTNLLKNQDDHVKRIAEFAIDAVQAARETPIDVDDPSLGVVKIRAGFHSGPVVANVVGSRCPRYSLFGDSVNTASRMESMSQENRIQCSDRSAGMLQLDHPEIHLASRGLIKVKGKGEIRTYWVNEDENERGLDLTTNRPPNEETHKTGKNRKAIEDSPKMPNNPLYGSYVVT